MKKLIFLLAIILSFGITNASAQEKETVLFTGVIVENDSLKPVPFTNIIILNRNLGTISTKEGYFSFYAEKNDSVSFSAVGFKKVLFIIPETVETERYSIIQVMTKDTITLAETIIYPWPVNEKDFKDSFLNDEINDDEVVQAKKNIEISAIQQPKQVIFYEADAAYNYDDNMQEKAKEYYYNGQSIPITVLDPIAWYKFIKAWRRGDFKKKDKK